jgi:hypothetical protein
MDRYATEEPDQADGEIGRPGEAEACLIAGERGISFGKAERPVGTQADAGPDPGPGILYVPVRACASGTVTIRTGRLQSGEPIGLGFTSAASLAVVLGPGHPWIHLHLQALREMLAPHGITRIRIDPLPAPAQRHGLQVRPRGDVHPPGSAAWQAGTLRHPAGR